MQVDPAYFNNQIAGLSGNNPAAMSQAEGVTQAALMLGYLALLCQNSPAPGTDQYKEMVRIWNLYNNTYKSFLDKDTTIGPAVEAAYATLQDSQGNFTPQLFYKHYTDISTPSNNIVSIIYNDWLAKGMYTFGNHDQTSPDTDFALAMFMCSAGINQISTLGIGQNLNAFMGQGDGGGAQTPCYILTQELLFAYMGTEGSQFNLSESELEALMPQDTSKSMPEYDKFLSSWNTDYSIWQGETHTYPDDLNSVCDYWWHFVP